MQCSFGQGDTVAERFDTCETAAVVVVVAVDEIYFVVAGAEIEGVGLEWPIDVSVLMQVEAGIVAVVVEFVSDESWADVVAVGVECAGFAAGFVVGFGTVVVAVVECVV